MRHGGQHVEGVAAGGRHGRVAGSSVRGTFDELSDAERRILQLVVEGRANGDIASELFVSKRTVESHVTSLYRKLGVTTRVALARAGVVQAS